MSRSASTVLAVGTAIGFLFAWSFLHHGWLGRDQIVDTGIYERYGDAVEGGLVPYQDFKLEYPPAALPVFVLPAIGNYGDEPAYRRWFDREMAVCGCLALIGTALCLRALGASPLRTSLALWVFALSPLLLGSVMLTRFDWWPVALAAFALAALLWNRPLPSGVLLGIAIGAKLWPAVLAPLFLIWLARKHGGRDARRWAVVLGATLALIFVPFAVIAPHGLGRSFYAQLGRPLQIESLGSAILVAVHHWGGTTLHMHTGFGSQNVTGPGAYSATVITSIVQVGALTTVWLRFARGPAVEAQLVTACAAAVAAFVAFGKVFSPQFAMWVIPFVLLVGGARGVAAGVLLAAVLVLTHSWFPSDYWPLTNFDATPSAELLARDLCVVALFVVLAWPALQHEVLGKNGARFEALQRVRAEVE